MLRTLFTGMSGLRHHQRRMDVIGNNIANVNTIGYKASRVTFQEGFAEVLAQATRSSRGLAGDSPAQVGTGVMVGAVESRFTQGGIEGTGRPLDLAVQGDTLFALRSGRDMVYSRAGNFALDDEGRIVLGATGYVLQGRRADDEGTVAGSVRDLVIDDSREMPARATSLIELTGNLDASAAEETKHSISVTVFDGGGGSHELVLDFTRNADGSWAWTASGEGLTVEPAGPGTLVFGADGKVASLSYPGGGQNLRIAAADGGSLSVRLDAATGGLASVAGASTATVVRQDGREAGKLVGLSVDVDGVIHGVYSNGATRALAQVALASFSNPSALDRGDGNVYLGSEASGTATLVFAGDDTTSSVISGALETSNVDVAEEFTNMIITQRAFQASSRVISTANDMISEAIRLRR